MERFHGIRLWRGRERLRARRELPGHSPRDVLVHPHRAQRGEQQRQRPEGSQGHLPGWILPREDNRDLRRLEHAALPGCESRGTGHAAGNVFPQSLLHPTDPSPALPEQIPPSIPKLLPTFSCRASQTLLGSTKFPAGMALCFLFPTLTELSGSVQAPAWEWECPVGAGNSAGQIPKITKPPIFPRFPAQGFAQSQILCRNSFPPKPHTYKEAQNSRFSLGFLTSLCGAPRGFPALLEPRSLSGVFLSLPDPNSRG